MVGKNVNLYEEKSNQAAASGRYMHGHAGNNISLCLGLIKR